MFPKYKAGPINGEPVSSSDPIGHCSISQRCWVVMFMIFRQPAKRRIMIFERDSDKALKGRQKCLVKLGVDGRGYSP